MPTNKTRHLVTTPTTDDAFNALRQKLMSVPYERRVAFTTRSEEPSLGPIPQSRSFFVPRFNIMRALADQYAQIRGPITERLLLTRHLRLLAAEPGLSWGAFCERVARLPNNQLWRHNVQGDLPGDPLCFELDAEPLEQLVRANRGKRGFTMSYYHPKFAQNVELIDYANRKGFTINLVADSLAEADELQGWHIAPVVVRVPEDTAPLQRTPAGNKVVLCPQSLRRGVTCATCKLCAQAEPRHRDRDRDIVAFPIPGLKAVDLPPDILAEMM